MESNEALPETKHVSINKIDPIEEVADEEHGIFRPATKTSSKLSVSSSLG